MPGVLNAFVPQSMVPVKLIIGLATLSTLVMVPLYAYRTARSLGSTVAVLWPIVMFVPCFNLLALLVLSSRATSECRKRGIEVGFLGPNVP